MIIHSNVEYRITSIYIKIHFFTRYITQIKCIIDININRCVIKWRIQVKTFAMAFK